MVIPPEWLAEAGVQNFTPRRQGFRCDDPDHRLFALADIESPLRKSGVTLSKNGFDRDRMINLLIGMRNDVALPHIFIEANGPGGQPYKVAGGVHRYHASRTPGFTHIPAEIIVRSW